MSTEPQQLNDAPHAPRYGKILGCFLLALCLALIALSAPVCSPELFPPNWVQRKQQRKLLAERVAAAGGWSALYQECATLVESNKGGALVYYRRDGKERPPCLAILKPKQITFYSPELGLDSEPKVPVVKVKVFGMHSTGGNSYPYYGLEFVFGPEAGSYRPSPSHGGVSGNGYARYRQITNNIYEIY
jgi:hypothetical protein